MNEAKTVSAVDITKAIESMDYWELFKMNELIEQHLISKRKESMDSIARAYCANMAVLGATLEEMKAEIETCFGKMNVLPVTPIAVDEIKDIEPKEVNPALPEATPVIAEVKEIPDEPQDNTALPENKIETGSVYDDPAFQEMYDPIAAKGKAANPTPVAEEPLPSMESLLADDPKYKAYYEGFKQQKKNKLLSMDELLSGEPLNRIINMGNDRPKGASYRYHDRYCHVDGIIPTETASGKTGIYIPET